MTGARSFALFVCIALSVGCSTTTFSVVRLAPAEINIPAGKRLAVAPIGGAEGSALLAELMPALVAAQRFEVLDRAHVHDVLQEQDFNASGLVSDDSAVSIGQLTGAAALIVGDVTEATYGEKVNTQKQQCAREGKTYECTHYTRIAAAQLRVALKVLETETGKVLAAKNLQAAQQRTASAVDAEPPPIDAEADLLAGCRKRVVEDFIKVVAPHSVSVAVVLLDDGDLPQLEMGNNYAKLGNWPQAIAQYDAAVQRADGDAELDNDVKAKAHYDLGVALGYSGRYDEGITQLEHAYALDPQDLYQQQVATLKRFKEDDAKLAEQQASRESE